MPQSSSKPKKPYHKLGDSSLFWQRQCFLEHLRRDAAELYNYITKFFNVRNIQTCREFL